MKAHLRNIQQAFREVFSNTSYIVFASTLAVITFLFAIYLPNFGLITEVFTNSSAPLATKFNVVISLLGGIRTNFSILSALYTIAISLLFGINIAMITYFLKRKRQRIAQQGMVAGISGMASGALGVGCAACGSFLLSTILASFGAAGALAILPLKGGEFGILSVTLLTVSLTLISRQITKSLTCKT